MSREMKDSGIAWIGEIPKGWEVRKMRTLGTFSASGIDKLVNPNESLVRIINYVDVYNNTKHELRKKDYMMVSASDEKITEHQVKIGDIILTPSSETVDDIGVSSVVMEELPNTAYSYHVLRFRSKDILNLSFKKYLTNNRFIAQYFSSRCNGTIRKTVSREIFKECPILLPPLPEQQKIAEFLDRKCGEIDELVALQEKMIEELKAYKQSVITEAVTKGLNPNAPMKDSGIAWIGEIPEHWDCFKFWKVNNIRGRLGWKGLKAEEYQEVGYPFLSAYNIIQDKLDWSDVNYITQERYDESPEIKLNIGDILIVKDGAGIGKCARVDNLPKGEATVNSSLAVITPNNQLFYKFEYYYLLSTPFQYVIWFLKIGMGVPHLTQENMRDIIFVYPSFPEQQQIADYLDRKCAEIDELVAVKQQKIETLKEYKKSLIYEYVTGKKEVI